MTEKQRELLESASIVLKTMATFIDTALEGDEETTQENVKILQDSLSETANEIMGIECDLADAALEKKRRPTEVEPSPSCWSPTHEMTTRRSSRI